MNSWNAAGAAGPFCPVILLLALTLLPPFCYAQSQGDGNGAPDNQSGYTLKLRSELVSLDVVVRNSKGELVRGLHRQDFSVTEGKVPQEIVSFDATYPALANGQPTVQINSTAELDRREPNAPVTILILDEITIGFADQYLARYAVEQYLRKQGNVLSQPMTLIARTISRTMVLSDYTTSKKQLLDSLNRHTVINDVRAGNANNNDLQMSAGFASLLEIAKATEGHAGHKNLVWIGRGFPTLDWEQMPPDQVDALRAAVERCMDLLRQARVTVSVIDPAGVQAPFGTTDESGIITLEDPFAQQVSFDTLAQATGGVSMHGRNDVDRLVGEAVAAGSEFYTLTYKPTIPAEDDPRKFRSIRVLLKNTALTATNREGYYPLAPSAAPAPAPTKAAGKLAEGTVFDLASASSGMMVFDGIPLTLLRTETPTPEVRVAFPASSLHLALVDGKLSGDITLITLSYDRNGKLLTKDGRVVSLHLAVLDPGKTEERIVHLTTPIDEKLPIARMRIVVRSNTNGELGADNLFLVDPGTLRDRATGKKPQ
ncbi:MAG: VWA domain-containing protein [Janthinobacterium lividum]